VAVDDRYLVVEEAVAEDGDDAGLAVRVLTWPVDVPEPEHCVSEPV
jgi:hypothetical protein